VRRPAGGGGAETRTSRLCTHGHAPTSAYYAGANCDDDQVLDAMSRRATRNQASIGRHSGATSSRRPSPAPRLARPGLPAGALQGIWFLSYGDNGDEQANNRVGRSTGRTNRPYVTAVGGTSERPSTRAATVVQTGWVGHREVRPPADGSAWNRRSILYGAAGVLEVYARHRLPERRRPDGTTWPARCDWRWTPTRPPAARRRDAEVFPEGRR